MCLVRYLISFYLINYYLSEMNQKDWLMVAQKIFNRTHAGQPGAFCHSKYAIQFNRRSNKFSSSYLFRSFCLRKTIWTRQLNVNGSIFFFLFQLLLDFYSVFAEWTLDDELNWPRICFFFFWFFILFIHFDCFQEHSLISHTHFLSIALDQCKNSNE